MFFSTVYIIHRFIFKCIVKFMSQGPRHIFHISFSCALISCFTLYQCLVLIVFCRFPTDKFHSLDTSQDALLVMRQITNQKLRTIYYREHRPNLIAENITFEMDGADVCILKLFSNTVKNIIKHKIRTLNYCNS